MKNIVLIGMPGSGKSTFAKIISRETDYHRLDLDQFIVKESGQAIADLFAISEDHFRDWESRCCKKISHYKRQVIATGGGVIKRPENIEYLKKNGVIFFIDRPIEEIAADVNMQTRPLLKDGLDSLYQLHAERDPLYRQYADYIIENDGSQEKVLAQILDYMLLENKEADHETFHH